MLSDRERKTLLEIQRQLAVEDAEFERSFRALERPTVAPARHRSVYTAVIAIAVFLGVVMLFAGSPVGALAFMVTAGSVWMFQYLRNAASQPERQD